MLDTLIVDFSKDKRLFLSLDIGGVLVESVKSARVLQGLIIQDDMKWNEYVNINVKKAGKRLYMLRILKRSKFIAGARVRFPGMAFETRDACNYFADLRMTFRQYFFLQDWFRNKFGVVSVRVWIKVMVRVGVWSRVSVSS